MNELIIDSITALAIAFLIFYGAWVIHMFIANRKRYRVTCECGHQEKAYSLTSAKWAATEHMMRCKGKAIVSPLPPVDIAAAAE